MKQVKQDRPLLAGMIAASPAGDKFLVPGPLCAPVLVNSFSCGQAQRVLFSLLWLSAEVIRSGVTACFRASLAEIRIASGFEGYAKDVPVIAVLDGLRDELCRFEDGEEVGIFQRLEVIDQESRTLEWIFTEEFIDLFVSPPTFAVVGISEMARLKSGLDFFLYLQLRRIWKMRRSAVTLPVDDLALAAGFTEGESFRRVAERVRRAVARLEAMMGRTVMITPLRDPGSRFYSSIQLEMRKHG